MSKSRLNRSPSPLTRKDIFLQSRRGYIQFKEHKHRLKILGTVRAGFPSPSEEELSDTITLDEYLVPNKTSCFIFRVPLDEMSGAGIQADDLVIVDRARDPRSGDIVVIELASDYLVRRWDFDGTRIVLRAENDQYLPLYPKKDVNVFGVVTGVVRKYY